MPADLKERMLKSISFQPAYALGENLAATCLDLAWHELTPDEIPSPYMAGAFEKEALNNVGLLNSQIPPRYSLTFMFSLCCLFNLFMYHDITSAAMTAAEKSEIGYHAGYQRR